MTTDIVQQLDLLHRNLRYSVLIKLLVYYYHVGLVVPDVPLEETDFLRSEAAKNNLELVGPFSCTLSCFTTVVSGRFF